MSACSRTYKIFPENDRLQVDPNTGAVSVLNYPSPMDYEFDIIVSHVGGHDAMTQSRPDLNPDVRIRGLRVSTVCCEDSTTISQPTCLAEFHESESNAQYRRNFTFTNSNPACPLSNIHLDAASATGGFNVTRVIEPTGSTYTLTLAPALSQLMGVY